MTGDPHYEAKIVIHRLHGEIAELRQQLTEKDEERFHDMKQRLGKIIQMRDKRIRAQKAQLQAAKKRIQELEAINLGQHLAIKTDGKRIEALEAELEESQKGVEVLRDEIEGHLQRITMLGGQG